MNTQRRASSLTLRDEGHPSDGVRWITDPRHGWLRVRLSTLRPIAGEISAYSYADFDYAYLEEDRDAGKWLRWYGFDGSEFPCDHYDDDDCFVRRLPGIGDLA